MTQAYLVECFWPGVSEGRVAKAVRQLEAVDTGEDGVTWVDSILVPDDEIVLCVFEGRSMEAVRASADRAGLPAERIVACVQVPTLIQREEQVQ
jgi:Nickel responsive protein SCO4226-like